MDLRNMTVEEFNEYNKDHIINSLKKVICPIHNIPAEMTKEEGIKIGFSFCCETLRELIEKELK